MGVGAVSFVKISFGIVNPELVKRQIADRVEEVGEIVEEQRKAAAENERLRRQAAAEELLEAASRAAVAKRAAKALRLRREQELTTRLFWLWRSWTDKALHVRRERAAELLNRLCRMRLAAHAVEKWREDVALRRYLLECKSALAVQRVLRGMWGRREAAEKRRVESRACVRIQSVHRGRVVRREVAEMRAAMVAAATALAKVYRGRAARIELQRQRVAGWASTIAAVSKLWFARRRLRASLRRRACVRIQTEFRASRARVHWRLTRALIAKHRAAVYIGKMWRGYFYRSRRSASARKDAAAIEKLLLDTGLRRHVERMAQWGGGLTVALLQQVDHQQQLGGSWWSSEEECFWGISDMGDRARLLQAIADMRARRRKKLRRQRRRGREGKTWKNADVERLAPKALDGVLVDAAAAGDIETVSQMLAVRRDGGPVDLESVDAAGRTAFHLSVAGGHFELAKVLVKAGAATDPRDSAGATPFTSACQGGMFPRMVRWLHEELGGVDVAATETGEAGNSGFGHAVWNGNMKLVEYFVEVLGGAAVDPDVLLGSETWGRVTPFFASCAIGHTAMAQYLYRCGFDTVRPSAGGIAPRNIAEQRRHAQIIRLMDSWDQSPGSPSLQSPEPARHARRTSGARSAPPELRSPRPATVAAVAEQQLLDLRRAQRAVTAMAARVQAASSAERVAEGWLAAPVAESSDAASKRASALRSPARPRQADRSLASSPAACYLPPLTDALPRDEPPPELADMYARCASQRPKYFRDTLGLETT